MQEWLSFLKNQLPSKESQAILPSARISPLDFEWLPENNDEFELIVNNAPAEILEGLGFVRYSSIPEWPYREKQKEMDALLKEDVELFLIPGEWYKIIPDRYSLINISAQHFDFEPGKTDDTTRLGCLSYGIPVQLKLL